MYRRLEVLMCIIVLGLMGTIYAILFISMFTFTGYDFFSQGLSFLLVAGFVLAQLCSISSPNLVCKRPYSPLTINLLTKKEHPPAHVSPLTSPALLILVLHL